MASNPYNGSFDSRVPPFSCGSNVFPSLEAHTYKRWLLRVSQWIRKQSVPQMTDLPNAQRLGKPTTTLESMWNSHEGVVSD